MFTLAVWAVCILWCLASFGFALARVARRFGSPRGRFGVGVGAVALVMAIGVVLAIAGTTVGPALTGTAGPSGAAGSPTGFGSRVADRPEGTSGAGDGVAAVVSVALTVLHVWIAFRVLRGMFRVTARQTWGLLGVYLLVAIGNLALLELVVRRHLSEAFVIPTASMEPTLAVGDRIGVDKRAEPRRWDVVAYFSSDPLPPGSAAGQRPIYCHRVVGLPGERLRFENGTVYADDVAQTSPAATAGRYTMAPGAGGRTFGKYEDGQTVQLGPEEFFVVGDNVERSGDSRLRGPTVRADLVGVVDLVYWPATKVAVLR